MKPYEIDKPSPTPIKLYLDISSFLTVRKSRTKIDAPMWVYQTIDKLSFDFEFYGLRDGLMAVNSDNSYSFVCETYILPINNWSSILRNEGSVLFYFGQPSDKKILQIANSLIAPFSSSPAIITEIVAKRIATKNIGRDAFEEKSFSDRLKELF
jgi:hypothetical protein